MTLQMGLDHIRYFHNYCHVANYFQDLEKHQAHQSNTTSLSQK